MAKPIFTDMEHNNSYEVAYAINNASSLISDDYFPSGGFDGCKIYILKSFDVLISSICKYYEKHKKLPKFLVLKDHVAWGVMLEYFCFFDSELLKKLEEKGFSNLKVVASYGTDFQGAVDVIRKHHSEYPFRELTRSLNAELEYMGYDDERRHLTVYELRQTESVSTH